MSNTPPNRPKSGERKGMDFTQILTKCPSRFMGRATEAASGSPGLRPDPR